MTANRRELMVAALGGASFLSYAPWINSKSLTPRLETSSLRSQLGDSCVTMIEDADANSLWRTLFGDNRNLSSEGMAARLRAQHREDLAILNLVSVEGWLLTQTEMRAYALASLLG